jgi:hypothetical protein
MSINCPRCNSHRVTTREAGKRAGASLGVLTGAALAVVTVVRGGVVGAAAGALAGPAGIIGGSLTGAILAGLFAGSAGGAIGSAMGKVADQNFLDNRKCLHCGFTFRIEDDDDATGLSAGGPPRRDLDPDAMSEHPFGHQS